ncbi:hypothetical protein HYN59_16260 [Flavobacterium album]|uniref:Uncharacterized protein n=2 Tax=Flavobacterium album TaxID=2175091 RepID=A0A2S1R1P8_9FLAO|nr:hypothetical protein HYN59_16260 [Flavobacterium album]
MTFVDEDKLGLRAESVNAADRVRKIVLEKFLGHNFQLADFNWSGNYDSDNTRAYFFAPYRCETVVEIRLELDIAALATRDAIYDQCLSALKNGELALQHLELPDDRCPHSHHSLVHFARTA